MKRKPWILIVLALVHIFAPVGSFLFNAVSGGRSLAEQWHYWTQVLPPYFLIFYVALPMLAGIFIFVCKRWSYFAYLVCIIIIMASNVFSFYSHRSWTTFFLLLFVLLIDILLVAYFIVPSVKKLYLDPRMRWWESKPRYKYAQTGHIENKPITITNISEGGLLFSSDLDFPVGNDLEIIWQDAGKEFKAIGEVVYKIKAAEPPANGFKFKETDFDKREILQLTRKLHSEDQIIKDRLPGPEDGFSAWLKNLVTSGKGIIP